MAVQVNAREMGHQGCQCALPRLTLSETLIQMIRIPFAPLGGHCLFSHPKGTFGFHHFVSLCSAHGPWLSFFACSLKMPVL